jgi:hypothetical protein
MGGIRVEKEEGKFAKPFGSDSYYSNSRPWGTPLSHLLFISEFLVKAFKKRSDIIQRSRFPLPTARL